MLDPSGYSTTNTKDHTQSPSKPNFHANEPQSINNDTVKVARQTGYLRLKGLPWGCTKAEIVTFFEPVCKVENEDIYIIFLPDGRASGEALVGVADKRCENEACDSLNQQYIHQRYIDVHRASPDEWNRVLNRKQSKHSVPISDSSFVILMRGLPYSAHEDDCIEFFKPVSCLGVHFTKDAQGRPSGQGYAEFENKADYDAAMKCHKKSMQNRYIELFESSTDELIDNVKGRRRNRAFQPTIQYHQTNGYTTSVVSQNGPPACIKMRGLPYNTRENDITEFFQRENVTPSRIHRKKDGAEAFVEFANPSDAHLAMKLNKAFMGKRYVELFRVEYDEMAAQVGIAGPPPETRHHSYGPPRGGRGPRGRPHHGPPGRGGYGRGGYDNYGHPPRRGNFQRHEPYRANRW